MADPVAGRAAGAPERLLSIEVELVTGRGRGGPAFPDTRDGRFTRLDLLFPGTSFAYVFDLGADWTHLCTVRRDDLGGPSSPPAPLLRHGWGTLPDQYGRNRLDDHPTPPVGRRSAGTLTDLPPLLPSRGPRP